MKALINHVAISALLSCCLWSFTGCSDNEQEKNYSLVNVGDRVPSFTINTAALPSESFDSSSAVGKTMFIYFLASYCPDCHKATPAVIELSKMLNADKSSTNMSSSANGSATESDVVILCIARGQNATLEQATQYWGEVAAATNTAPESMPTLYYDAEREVYNKFATQNIPRFYIIDTKGNISWQSEGQPTAAELYRQIQSAK